MYLKYRAAFGECRRYRDPYHRIGRLLKAGRLIPLKRGLYETDRSVSPCALAGCLCGPSYLSFDYALSFYGMIPERVTVYTSATFRKRRTREFSNDFGTFSFQDVPSAVYPYGYTRIDEKPCPYLLAGREKALCDKLYSLPPIRGLKAFREYLFDGLRLDEEIFEELDREKIRFIAPKYHRTNLTQLLRMISE